MSSIAEDSSGKTWRFLRSALFQCDPECAHRMAMRSLAVWMRFVSADVASNDIARDPRLKRTFFGLDFPNPLGLAAGFDKNAEAIPAWQKLGFGFVEVGTVTSQPQAGNPRPRLFRLPKDHALLNRMGFNNDGAKVVAKRIEETRKRFRITIPVGVNIGKSKVVPIEQAAKDYIESFVAVADVSDYVVINVSSPNTPGLRDLQQEEHLAKLLDAVCTTNTKRNIPRPLLLKLSPDLDHDGAHACARLSLEQGLRGLVVTNTTMERSGGISGKPLFERSTAMLRELRLAFGSRLTLIGVGGIMDEKDAREKFSAGADLIQAYTGFVYGGPSLPRRILRTIVKG